MALQWWRSLSAVRIELRLTTRLDGVPIAVVDKTFCKHERDVEWWWNKYGIVGCRCYHQYAKTNSCATWFFVTRGRWVTGKLEENCNIGLHSFRLNRQPSTHGSRIYSKARVGVSISHFHLLFSNWPLLIETDALLDSTSCFDALSWYKLSFNSFFPWPCAYQHWAAYQLLWPQQFFALPPQWVQEFPTLALSEDVAAETEPVDLLPDVSGVAPDEDVLFVTRAADVLDITFGVRYPNLV